MIELDGRLIGYIQYFEETDPDYRHAMIDIALHPTGATAAWAPMPCGPWPDTCSRDSLLMDLLAEELMS